MMRRLVAPPRGRPAARHRRAHLARDHHHLHRHAGAVRRRRRARRPTRWRCATSSASTSASPCPWSSAADAARRDRAASPRRTTDSAVVRAGGEGRWWAALAGADAPKIFARLPFIEVPERPAELAGLCRRRRRSPSPTPPDIRFSRSPTRRPAGGDRPRFGGAIVGRSRRRCSWWSCRSPSTLRRSGRGLGGAAASDVARSAASPSRIRLVGGARR